MFLNKGGGVLGPRKSYSIGATPLDVVIGDLNADSRRDLIVSTSTGVRIYLASGAPGSFGAPTAVLSFTLAGAGLLLLWLWLRPEVLHITS